MQFRHECKHYINECDAVAIRSRIRHVARLDPHADNTTGKYQVKSLYFDNCFDEALREKQDGTDRREKFRIRYYNNDLSFIRLEKKSKVNGMSSKVSVPIDAETVSDLINGTYAEPTYSDSDFIKELYAKMKFKLLRPKSIVSYSREAYILDAGNVRVTFDGHIAGSSDTFGFLSPDTVMTHLFGGIILEVKWDAFLPEIIRNMLQTEGVSPVTFSKYAATRFSAF